MILHVQLFAKLREEFGVDHLEIAVPPDCSVATLRWLLGERFPAVRPLLAASRFAVNESYAADESLLPADGTVAIIPPVSGG